MADLVGRENVYTCKTCKAQLVTVDRDAGTTPMFLRCGDVTAGDCRGIMESAMYWPRQRPAAAPGPTHEWYRPSRAERRRIARNPRQRALADHVRQGGLLLRPIARRP